MGSLKSRPKVTAAVTPVVTVASNTAEPAVSASAADPDVVAKTRAENVLRKNRGVLGTVLTGFRGLLGDTDTGTTLSRKTLLGE